MGAMRVLLIEDDRKAAKLLTKGLQEEGFVVDVAATGEDGEVQATVNDYDVILLDWLLPGKDGVTVCRELRAHQVSTPILMLTARDGLADRVNGLTVGADDYLTKPFAFAELLARIRALLRRSRFAQPTVIRVADLTIDLATRRVTRGGALVPLTAREFAILEVLARSEGRDRQPDPPRRARVGRGLGGAGQPGRRPREPPAQEDRPREHRPADPHRARLRVPAGITRPGAGMRPLGFKTRLWLGHVAVLAVMLTLAAFGADWALRRVVLGRIIDDAVLWLASTEAAALQADPAHPVRVHEMAPGAGPPSFARLDKFVQITDLDGQVVARSATLGTSRLPTPAGMLERAREGETVFGTVSDFGEEPIRMVLLPATVGTTRYAIQVAMSLDDAYAVLHAGRWLVFSMSIVILAGIGFTSARLARRALQPIDRVVTRARRIGEANLADRLPHPGTQDEIGRLVETLNDMLGRLERSFEAQRRFTADASHELRSPLSRLRAELEVTLRRPREAGDYEETLRSCLDEVERVQSLIEELLALARIDARQEPEAPEPVSVGDIVAAAVAAVRPKAARRSIEVTIERPADLLVTTAPVAAQVALANILDNAVKFSPPGGQVRIVVTAGREEAVIAVSDCGPGVAPEEAAQLFERFYRGKASHSAGAPGVGLGLAISRALVERQGGRISVDTRADAGATFSVRLPRA